MENQKLSYPQTKERLNELAWDIFSPVSKRYCISCFFVSGTGKRVLIKFLIREKEILKSIFGNAIEKTLFIYIDPDEILDITNEAYLQLILQNLIIGMKDKQQLPVEKEEGISNPLLIIKKNVEKLLNDGWHVVFLLNDFEFTLQLSPSIFRNLESILSLKKNQISYIFLSTTNLLEQNTLDKFHNLKYAINRVVYYYPMLDDSEIEFTLSAIEQKLKIKLSNDLKKVIKELCGGHAQLLKYTTTILKEAGEPYLSNPKKAKDYIFEYEQIKSVCNDIWNYFNDLEKEILINVARTNRIPSELLPEATFLLKTNTIIPSAKNSDNYSLFGELFLNFIRRQIPAEKLSYDSKTNQIFFGTISSSDIFTLQEFKMMSHFLQNEGKVISRDEVGQVIWGRNYVDQYSDYSIDKLISSIRKKLDSINFPSYKLVTLKKRGFSFSN